MARRRIIGVVVLIVVALWAATQLHAQLPPALTLVQPTIVTGPDVGFRVERVERGIPVGTLVVKVDGKWVDAQFSGGVVRATQ
jgi:hypothetical protein